MHFAKDMRFADAPGNELCDLGAEIQNKNFLMHEIDRK
jgi:hypothetical protein